MVQLSLRSALQALTVLSWFHLLPMHVTSFSPPRGQHVSSIRRPLQSIITGMIPLSDDGASRHQQLPLAISNRHGRPSYTIPLFAEPPAATSTTTTNNIEEEEEEEELTPLIIAEMIEVSFLQSCLQLSQGYIDVLKLFIVAVKAGYEDSLPLSELHQLVETCPVNSAGRDLMKEEKELRLEWMKVVYEIMNELKPGMEIDSSGGKESDDDDTAKLRISEVVKAMLAIQNELQNEEETSGGSKDANVALTNLTVDQMLERSPSLSELNESISDPMEKAFLTNDIRVAMMTFRVLEEERICNQDASGRAIADGGEGEETVPRPPIPGT